METSDGWYYDPGHQIYNSWFGVQGLKDGFDVEGTIKGQSGTLAAGLDFGYAGPNAFMDELGATSPAQVLLRSTGGSEGRAVIHDGGTYRTIGSAFELGGLKDGTDPETRKELLLRYLDFFGVTRPELRALAEARLGSVVPLRLEGNPGDGYLLLASLAEGYLKAPGYGILRLDLSALFILGQGAIPGAGQLDTLIPVPRDPDLVDWEVHFQAVTGPAFKPGQAHLTNREILTFTE